MARVTPARIVQKAQGTAIPPDPAPEPRTLERLAREELEAREAAARTIAEAKRAADALVADARAKAASVAQTAAREAAEAEQATYDVEAGQITLTGDVVLTRGQNVLVGERMVVDLGAGTAAVEGRVRSVFQPGGE